MPLRVKIEGTPIQVVSLSEAKDWLTIDFNDYDLLIQSLIKSCVARSQAVSGTSFWPVEVTVTGNKAKEFIYPITPVIEELEEPEDDTEYESYTYNAGFAVGEFPDDLKRAVLQRVATGFLERQNGLDAAINKATEPSLNIELAYRENLYL